MFFEESLPLGVAALEDAEADRLGAGLAEQPSTEPRKSKGKIARERYFNVITILPYVAGSYCGWLTAINSPWTLAMYALFARLPAAIAGKLLTFLDKPRGGDYNISAMATVTLYGKPGCHLCEEALNALLEVQ